MERRPAPLSWSRVCQNLRAIAYRCSKQGGTAVIEFIVVPASSDAGTFLFHRLCVLRDHAGCREVSLRRESFSADFFDAIVDSVSNLQKGMEINV